MSQEALAANVRAILDVVDPRPGDCTYSWLPLSHDMGLVGILLSSLVAGGPEWSGGDVRLVLEDVVRTPHSVLTWLKRCASWGASVTAVPPLALDLAVGLRGDPGDLHRLRCCIVGGDSVRERQLRAFCGRFAANGIEAEDVCPAYGLSEAGLAVTMSPPGVPWHAVPFGTDLDSEMLVSCGQPLPGTAVRAGGALAGRVEISSPSLCDGYVTTRGLQPPEMDGGWMKTEDTGIVDANGELYPIGRTADLIVVRGSMYRPEAIESLGGSAGFRPGHLAVVQLPGGELVAAGESASSPATSNPKAALRASVHRAYGLRLHEVYIVGRGHLPRTTSGKLKRELIRRMINRGELEVSQMSTVAQPGSVARWCVVHPDGRRGSSWSMRTADGEDDVYVTHREGGRWIHASFHSSGEWHYGVTRDGLTLDPEAPQYLGVVMDHAEAARGWLHAMRITVANSELREGYREGAKQRDLIEVPADPEFDAVSIDLFLRDPDAELILVDRAILIAELARAHGGSAVLLARPTNLAAPIHEALASQIAEMRDGIREQGWDGSALTRGVIIIEGDEPGCLEQLEVAIDPD